MQSAQEIAQIKADLEATLSETCTIRKRTRVSSGTGIVFTEEDRATNVPCRRASLGGTGGEFPVAGAIRDQEEIVLTVKLEQAIFSTDRVVFSNASYEVVRILTTQHQAYCKRVLCKAV